MYFRILSVLIRYPPYSFDTNGTPPYLPLFSSLIGSFSHNFV